MIIPYGRQDITEEDIESVIKVLRSDFLTQGSAVPIFENKLCEYTGSKYAIAVNSCTSALHIACLSLDLGPDDILWTSPISFVASANCAIYCGATVDFVDIDPSTALMSVGKLKEKLELARKEKKIPKIVILVHFSGQPCDMEEVYALSKQYGFRIIEDAAHAIGAKYQNEPVGNCHYSDITVFSFHPVKIITTGEGGVAMTNNSLYAEKMELYRSHGITRNPINMHKKIDAPWYYEQVDLGYNYRMTDIQAALGSSQLNRLDQYVSSRTRIASLYNDQFKDIPVDPLMQKSDRSSSHHLYVIKVIEGQKMRDKLYNGLYEKGIGVNLHYIPINQHPFFQQEKYKHKCSIGKKISLNNSNIFYTQALTLPLYPGLKTKQLQYIIQEIFRIFKNG